MNEPDVSGLLCIGMHEMDMGQESYATECLKMNKDTSAMHADHGNTSTFLEEQHLSGIQPLEELRFCNTQHSEHQSQGMLANSEDESMPSSPDTSSTSNHDSPGYMEHLQDIYKAFDQLVDKDGPVMLSPEYIMCDETLHLGPHLTFSSDGIKIEYMDLDSDKMITFGWGLSNIISISCKWAQSIGSAQLSFLAESEAENGNSGPVKVQFSLLDPQWPRKQQEIWHLEARYQEIWEDIPSDVFELENWSTESSLFFPRQYFSSTDDFEEVIYPKGDPDAVSISKRDAELLLPETFVNDTIIDFYIKYLTTRIEPTEKCRYHFFNSFFFRKLADLDKDQGRAPDGRAAFLRVRKWTRKINIFEKDFVFIPVNFSLHWSLIVICYPGEMATLGDGSATLSAKLPCILHMDSLKGSHSGLKDIIQSYLSEEWKERHPESATDNSDKFLNLRFFSLELPQQDNSFDCGLFLLHYVELFLMDAPRNFNPLESDVFSGFLGHDWFHPAEASHKRSVIQKLINELVTGSFQDHPKLACSNEPPDERHQSRNAEGEPAGVSITQRCSADRTELVSTIGDDADGAQLSTSICLNDSKSKVISASGGMADTEMVSMDAVNNIQESVVCLPENDTVICLSSQDEKNETLLHVRSCVTEDDEIPKGSYMEHSDMEHSESFLLTLNDNIKYSSHTEVKVQGIMTTNSCSISYNSEEVVTHQEYSLQKNTDEVGHECHMPSQDVDSLVMLDSSKGDIGPNLERMTDEDDARDLGENMVSDTQGDINKDVSELKREDRLADHKTVENAFKDRVKETDTNPGNINHGEQCVSFELTERNADNDMACDISQLNVRNTEKGVMCDDVISSGLSKGNKNQIMEGIFTYKTNINTDGMEELLATSGAIHAEDAIAGAVPCEDRTCSEAQYGTVPHEGDTSCADAEMTVPENTTKRPLLDGFCAEEKDIVVSDYKFAKKDDGQGTVSCEETTCSKAQDGAVAREGDISCTDAEAPLVERACHINNETVPENTAFGAERSLLDGICDSEEKDIVVSGDKCTQKDDSQAKRSLPGVVSCEETTCSKAQDGAVSREGDTSCMDAEMPLLERACHINNKTVTENSTSDAERPLLDGFCGSEEKDIVVSDDKCAKKDDSQGTVAKRPLPGAVPCEDTTCSEAQDGTVSREGGTSCIDAEMPLVERSCHINNETVPENTTFDAKKSLIDGICDSEAKNIIVVSYEKCTQKADSQERHGTVAKRPPPDMICDNDIVFSGDKCTKKEDVQDTDAGRPRPDSLSEENVVSESCIEKDSSRGTDAKIERYYKRRKVLALERSSSGVSS